MGKKQALLLGLILVFLVSFAGTLYAEDENTTDEVKLPDKPPVLLATQGLGKILDDVQFLLEKGSSADSYELFNGVLIETFSPGVDYARPMSFQVYDLLGKMNMAFNMPVEDKVFLHMNDVLIVKRPTERQLARGDVKEMSGLAAFLYSLEQGDFANKNPREDDPNFYEFYKSASGFLKFLPNLNRAVIGGEKDVEAPIVSEEKLSEILKGYLIAVQLDPTVYDANYLKEQFEKFKKKTIEEMEPMKGESDAVFEARKHMTVESMPAAEEFFLQVAGAWGGLKIDREKEQVIFDGNMTPVEGSTLGTHIAQLGKIKSAFTGISSDETAQWVQTALPLTPAQRAAISATGVYEKAIVKDTFEKNGIEYWVPKKKEEKEGEEATEENKEEEEVELEKKFIELKFSDDAKWFLEFSVELVVSFMDNAISEGYFDSVLKTKGDDDGRYGSVMGIRIHDQAKLTELFNKAKEASTLVTLDAIEVDGGKIHTIKVPEDLMKLYPEVYDEHDKIYLAQVKLANGAETLWYASGLNSEALLKSVIGEANGKAELTDSVAFKTDLSLGPILSALKRQLAEYDIPEGRTEKRALQIAEQMFERYSGTDRIRGSLEGDGKLATMHFEVDSGAVKTLGRIFGYFVDDALDE